MHPWRAMLVFFIGLSETSLVNTLWSWGWSFTYISHYLILIGTYNTNIFLLLSLFHFVFILMYIRVCVCLTITTLTLPSVDGLSTPSEALPISAGVCTEALVALQYIFILFYICIVFIIRYCEFIYWYIFYYTIIFLLIIMTFLHVDDTYIRNFSLVDLFFCWILYPILIFSVHSCVLIVSLDFFASISIHSPLWSTICKKLHYLLEKLQIY